MKKICRSSSKLHAIRQKVKSRETPGVQTVIAEPSPFAYFFFFSGNSHHSCSNAGKGEQPDLRKLKIHGCVCIYTI